MSLITNNPFRMLGVYSNASVKEIAVNKAKLVAFLKVGKNISLPTDSLIAENVERTAESVEKAVSDINLPVDKLKYALFWFIKVSSIDEIALNHLAAGGKAKVIELFGRKDTFSLLQNVFNYYNYNNANGDDKLFKIMKLQKYVSMLVFWQIAKDRYRQNTEILQKIISKLPSKEVMFEIKCIKPEQKELCCLPFVETWNRVVYN